MAHHAPPALSHAVHLRFLGIVASLETHLGQDVAGQENPLPPNANQ